MNILFHNNESDYNLQNRERISDWIASAIEEEGFEVGDINFIFCSSEQHIEMNRQYLGHDYYTDVITFDYAQPADDKNKGIISGDIFIDPDTVAHNAKEYGTEPTEEMLRVMIHGVLHLCGYDDHTEVDIEKMRKREAHYLSKIEQMASRKEAKVELIRYRPKGGGRGVMVEYGLYESKYGKTLIASIDDNLFTLYFVVPSQKADRLKEIKNRLPKATFSERENKVHATALEYINNPITFKGKLSILTIGTDFQFKVWNTLIEIPFGGNTTYGAIAKAISNPKASRAVGGAVGSNPISYIIPCHRVLASNGKLGGYRWGLELKRRILKDEGIEI